MYIPIKTKMSVIIMLFQKEIFVSDITLCLFSLYHKRMYAEKF